MSEDFGERLRRTLHDIRDELPDAAPPPEFWRRVSGQRARRRWFAHPAVQAAAACLVVLAVVGTVLVALRPSAPVPPAGSPGTTSAPGPTASVRCRPGTAVAPTATPSPAGEALTVQKVPAADLPAGIPSGAARVQSPAFGVLTEVGGCIEAWRLPVGATAPAGTTRVNDAPTAAYTRADATGLTEVYLTAADGRTYLAISGDVTARDLAIALDAALTRS